MNFTEQQEQELFNLSKIYASIVWWLLITLCLLALVYEIAKAIKQRNYFDSLTTEQQQIISKYNHVKVFEKKQKHETKKNITKQQN